MDFAIIGGDARMAYLARLMRSEGRDARTFLPTRLPQSLKTAKNVLLSLPAADENALRKALSPGTRLWTWGPHSENSFPDAVDLWQDERLKLENAYLTAEGAVCAAMNAGKKSLKDCRCLVAGWGRIGKALTEMLIGMNAETTVASRWEKNRRCAAERGAETVPTAELSRALPRMDVVFSTPPARIFTEDVLRHARPDALILDLSSAPHGVDLEAARSLNLRAWREPALPGRYCPYSAALSLLGAVRRAEGRLSHE